MIKTARSEEAIKAEWVAALRDNLGEAFGLRAGARNPRTAELGSGPGTILDTAIGSLDLDGRQVFPGGDGFQNIRAAVSTPTFGTIIEHVWRGVAKERPPQNLDDILALTHQMEVPDYRAQGYSLVDLEGMPEPDADTMNRYVFANVKITGEQLQVFTLFLRILITRQALVNGDHGQIRAAIYAFLRSSLTKQMQMIAALLESNPTLSDGAPMFHGDHGNLVSAPLDTGHPQAIGTLWSALRKQKTEGGDRCDAIPHVLLVHADDEITALASVAQIAEERRPRVVATSHLSSADSWYLLADPKAFPVVGRVMLEGADRTGVSFGSFEPAVETTPDGETREYPGLALPASHSVGFNILSRVGAVRCDKPA